MDEIHIMAVVADMEDDPGITIFVRMTLMLISMSILRWQENRMTVVDCSATNAGGWWWKNYWKYLRLQLYVSCGGLTQCVSRDIGLTHPFSAFASYYQTLWSHFAFQRGGSKITEPNGLSRVPVIEL